jgi:AraC-like DNA-binding protein
MTVNLPVGVERPVRKCREKSGFTEAPAWESVGNGWRQLHGNFRDFGYSIEWHDFTARRDLDWSRSFHPGSLEICLNVAGHGEVRAGRHSLELAASTAGFYAQNESRLTARRRGGERHQFITIELSLPFLERHALPGETGVNSRLSRVFTTTARDTATVSEPVRMTSEQQQLVMSLRRPPVYAAAQRLWYQAKALEVAAALLYQPLPGEELFCQRYKRLSQERVQKVVAILKHNLAEPPSLEEIGRQVGCSQFHLSRLFTQEMGKTISAHLRDLRMERAAELLRAGKMNVTEAAMEVGYSSLSHFTVAFRETFACCPGLYPLQTQQRNTKK